MRCAPNLALPEVTGCHFDVLLILGGPFDFRAWSGPCNSGIRPPKWRFEISENGRFYPLDLGNPRLTLVSCDFAHFVHVCLTQIRGYGTLIYRHVTTQKYSLFQPKVRPSNSVLRGADLAVLAILRIFVILLHVLETSEQG